MIDIQLTILYIFAFISLIPVIEINADMHRSHFKELKTFMLLVFVWSLTMVLKYSLTSLLIIYYLHMISYTIVFMIAFYVVRSVYEFYGKTIPKIFTKGMFFVFIIHGLIVSSNSATQWFLQVSLSDINALDSVIYADIGPLMIGHLIVAYSFLFYGIGYMIYGFFTRSYKKSYQRPVIIMIALIAVILPINLWYIITGAMHVDPTYLSAVTFSIILYYIVYKGNFIVSLSAEGRKKLLENMREYYILCTEQGKIIEVSPSLMKRYNLTYQKNIRAFINTLKKHTVLYDDIDKVKNKSIDRPYLFTIRKTFPLNRFKVQGVLHLFYDETKFVKLVDTLENMQNKDYMTDLLNRNYLETIIDDLEADFPNFGIVLTDLNALKFLNDTFGHKRGDEQILAYRDVLMSVKKRYPDVDIIRSGGDEFTLIVKEATFDSLNHMAKDIEETCKNSKLKTSRAISLGFALRKNMESFDVVNQKADEALYEMKKDKSDRYRQYLEENLNKKGAKS